MEGSVKGSVYEMRSSIEAFTSQTHAWHAHDESSNLGGLSVLMFPAANAIKHRPIPSSRSHAENNTPNAQGLRRATVANVRSIP